ncbi:hypothetical protein [Arthrobacter sp. STN4]|uniref:hypothetical protein n=1 Tax=Arthrobacter sp. STN4 TaxID=2923276 RepID=UPI002119EEC8|nr:hypothetical protein [Arthrobacter sp. STN4]MCQ9162642.1 hypothetical protein [Arthrobacter sp. STN4]
MTGIAVDSGRGLSGHTRISTQALTSVARAAAAAVFGVAPAAVRVSWSDDAGSLALNVSSPISVPSLAAVRRQPGRVANTGGTVADRATAAKRGILEQVEHLTGSQLSRVDVRISGIQSTNEGRVQ